MDVHSILSDFNTFHNYEVQAAVLCGSATTENSRKPQTYCEDHEGTVLTAIKTYTFRKKTAAFRRDKKYS